MKIVSIEDIAEKVDYGLTEKAKDKKVGPKFLRITDIQDDKVNWETVPYCKCDEKEFEKNKLEVGDIVFARTGATTGKSFLVQNLDHKAVFASYLIRLRLITDQVLPEFVSYFFKSDKYWNQIYADSDGATLPSFNATKLKALKIPLPSLSEQKAIVAKLDRAQRLIDIDKEMLAKYDELIQSVFLEMFGDDLKKKKNSKTLSEVTNFIDYRGQSPDKAEEGIPLITAKNVKEGFLNEEPKEYMNESSFEDWMTRGVPKPGDVLFTTEAPMGNACIIPEIDKFAIAQRLICFQLNEELIAEYLLNYLLSDLAKFEFEKRATGSTAKGIGSTRLKKVPVVIPDLDKQKEYQSIYRKIIDEKNVIEQSHKKSEELFSSLVQGAFG
ncbi:MAG: hypothetical protein CL670_07230 [Balneola sp.]|nr:hypothetical protein [Balneola sp.]MBE78927.1 hypothetical protein [Balneola sp.]